MTLAAEQKRSTCFVVAQFRCKCGACEKEFMAIPSEANYCPVCGMKFQSWQREEEAKTI